MFILTPFYDPNSQKSLSSNVKYSNYLHKKLERKADDIFTLHKDNKKSHPDKTFYALVNRNYHTSIYNWQSRNNRVANVKEKKAIYNANLDLTIVTNRNYNHHVPKKFKNKKINYLDFDKWL